MNSIDLVREFHDVYGQAIAPTPHIRDPKLNDLRISLLQEELNEMLAALEARDPVAVLDALTDLQYVLDGAYLSLGFHGVKDAALLEVHRSNMSKLGADGLPVYREDGKILKGPNYSPPDLAAVLRAVRDRASRERIECFKHDAAFAAIEPSLSELAQALPEQAVVDWACDAFDVSDGGGE